MSGSASVLTSVFAMRTSAFNDFLYAPVGEEENGMVLTALSALARLGVDPWAEAARLSALPRDAATKRLSAIISGSSHGQWAASAVNDIAARLAALLPPSQAHDAQSTAIMPAKSRPSAMAIVFLMIFFVNALAFTLLSHHGPEAAADQNISDNSGSVDPKAPLP